MWGTEAFACASRLAPRGYCHNAKEHDSNRNSQPAPHAHIIAMTPRISRDIPERWPMREAAP